MKYISDEIYEKINETKWNFALQWDVIWDLQF